jgi:hypothetical protein
MKNHPQEPAPESADGLGSGPGRVALVVVVMMVVASARVRGECCW